MIEISHATVNNLKDISINIPRDKFIVIAGVSGSGKSSLAFDTLYAEGQRRYVESLSSYARQFLGRMLKPECDYIKGLPPAIAIEQKVISRNPRHSGHEYRDLRIYAIAFRTHRTDLLACLRTGGEEAFRGRSHSLYALIPERHEIHHHRPTPSA